LRKKKVLTKKRQDENLAAGHTQLFNQFVALITHRENSTIRTVLGNFDDDETEMGLSAHF